MRRSQFSITVDGDEVPAILLLPPATHPVPAALLLHGYTSRKEHVTDSIGAALARRGIASLSIDLPLHGERREAAASSSASNPLELMRRWRAALDEASEGLRDLAARPEIDAGRLAIIGYSLGAFLGVIVAAREPEVRALILAAGGDLPEGTPFGRLVRTVADPIRAVRRYAGRPLLMVNGRRDRTVRPEQAERLFAAAGEPKAMRWWDAGHYLPEESIEDAVRWLEHALGVRRYSERHA
jgi:uncharacterized protein